jgi:hypothetical protein
MKQYFDGRLRPAYEFLPVIVLAASAGVLMTFAPKIYPIMPGVAVGFSWLFLLWALLRLIQGIRLLAYRRSLRRLPAWTMDAKELPVSDRRLFLGRGFCLGSATRSAADRNKVPGSQALSSARCSSPTRTSYRAFR